MAGKRADMLKSMKMPESPGAEEAEMDLEGLGLDEEEGEIGEEVEEMPSVLDEVEDEDIMREARKRGLVDAEEEEEELEDVDPEDTEAVPPQSITSQY